MAIEQLTGAAKAQATALTTAAKASASGVTDTGLELLGAAKKDSDAKRKTLETLGAEAKALPPAGECPDNPSTPRHRPPA
jgi:hypothetical protein